MKRILLSGARGRMGQLVAGEAKAYGFQVVAGVDPAPSGEDRPFPIYTHFEHVKEEADVLIDFSLPKALASLCEHAIDKGLPCVLCATGYQPAQEEMVLSLSKTLPVFRSANLSLGIHVLRHLCQRAAALLPGFDIEIVETHHRNKADAPSGTAKMLYQALAEKDSRPLYGRSPEDGPRKAEQIGLHALRGGTVAGAHEVCFFGEHEVLRLSHQAESRTIFAIGALKAAAFLMNQPPGLYGMDDYFAFLRKG